MYLQVILSGRCQWKSCLQGKLVKRSVHTVFGGGTMVSIVSRGFHHENFSSLKKYKPIPNFAFLLFSLKIWSRIEILLILSKISPQE